MRYSLVLSVFCLLGIAVMSHAQTSPVITVRVIDTKSGKPVPHRDIWVDKINPDTLSPIIENGLPLKGRTDAKGNVYFPTIRLHSIISKNKNNGDNTQRTSRKILSKLLDIGITYAAGGIQCSTGLFSLNEIITYGVVGDNHCDKKFDPKKFKVRPGEVIIFVGKYHWWEAGET